MSSYIEISWQGHSSNSTDYHISIECFSIIHNQPLKISGQGRQKKHLFFSVWRSRPVRIGQSLCLGGSGKNKDQAVVSDPPALFEPFRAGRKTTTLNTAYKKTCEHENISQNTTLWGEKCEVVTIMQWWPNPQYYWSLSADMLWTRGNLQRLSAGNIKIS